MSNNARASLSLMSTSRLPINVIQTKDIEQFYEKALEKNQLGVNNVFVYILLGEINFLKVPQTRINGRLQDPPQLRGPTIEILGIGEEEAVGDIVLSSAGTCFPFNQIYIRHRNVFIDESQR